MSSFISDFKKIKDKTFTVAFLSLLLFITPGVAIIFLLTNDLFLKLEFPKLIILAITLIAPLVILNFFVCSSLIEIGDRAEGIIKNENQQFESLMLSIMVSGFILYSVLMYVIFIGKDIQELFKAVGYTEIFIIIATAVKSYSRQKALK